MYWLLKGESYRLKDRDLGVPALRRVRGAEKRLPRMRCGARSRSGPSCYPSGKKVLRSLASLGSDAFAPEARCSEIKDQGRKKENRMSGVGPKGGGNFQTLERGQFSSVDKNVNSR